MLRQDTIGKCIERTKGYLKSESLYSPIFVNTENQQDYQAFRDSLSSISTTVWVSSFCADNDEDPNLDALFERIVSEADTNLLVLGFSQFLKFQGEKEFDNQLRKFCASSVKRKIVVLCYQSGNWFENLYNKDHRLDRQFFMARGNATLKPEVTFAQKRLKLDKSVAPCIGFKNLLSEMENDVVSNYAVSTERKKQEYPNSIISIKEISDAYDAVLLIDSRLKASLVRENGTEEQWTLLLSLLWDCKTLHAIFEKHLSTAVNFELLFSQWDNLSPFSQWLLFIALKVNGAGQKKCLTAAVNCSGSHDEMVENVFRGILEKSPSDKDFLEYYQERKDLVKRLDEGYVAEYCSVAKIKGAERIYYLTDNTVIERKQMVECLCESTFSEKDINDILKIVYPDLASYLAPYWFNVPLLDEYFQEYKFQKLTNKIHPSFLSIVEEHAGKREYNAILPYRSEKSEGINKEAAFMYFVDALGVEFLSFIMAKCKTYGLRATVTVCHSNLPSITSINKEIFDDFDSEKYYSYKALDDIKHHGAFDFDYQKTKLPIHITKELEVIDDVLQKSRNQLRSGDYKKVIIFSDHGASRLAVIANQVLSDIDVDSKGLHSGRCCVFSEDIPNIEYATEENGYYVLANYKRFKGGRAACVEVHGGATLEEVVVPILEIHLANENIEVWFVQQSIFVSFKKIAEITLFSKTKLSSVFICVNGKYYSGKTEDGRNFTISMPDIKRAGIYYASVYEENNLLADKLQFKVEKEGSKEKDLFESF